MTDLALPADDARLPELIATAITFAEALDNILDHINANAVPDWRPDQITVDKLADISEQVFWAYRQLENLMLDPNPHTIEKL